MGVGKYKPRRGVRSWLGRGREVWVGGWVGDMEGCWVAGGTAAGWFWRKRSWCSLVSPKRVVGCRGGSRYFEGDSKILIFKDAPRFPKLIFRTVLRIHHPPSIIQKVLKSFQNYVRFNRLYLCSKILLNYSRFTEIPPSGFPFLFKTIEIGDWRLLWTHQKQFSKVGVPHFPSFWKCWVFQNVEICKIICF